MSCEGNHGNPLGWCNGKAIGGPPLFGLPYFELQGGFWAKELIGIRTYSRVTPFCRLDSSNIQLPPHDFCGGLRHDARVLCRIRWGLRVFIPGLVTVELQT